MRKRAAGLNAGNTITVSIYDDTISERWPDPGVVVVRRTGGLQPLTVNIAFGGLRKAIRPSFRLSSASFRRNVRVLTRPDHAAVFCPFRR